MGNLVNIRSKAVDSRYNTVNATIGKKVKINNVHYLLKYNTAEGLDEVVEELLNKFNNADDKERDCYIIEIEN